MSSHDWCMPSTMATAAVDSPNKVVVLFTDAPDKLAPTDSRF